MYLCNTVYEERLPTFKKSNGAFLTAGVSGAACTGYILLTGKFTQDIL